MSLFADQITIAVTVYNRRQFVKKAIRTALEQTMPVRVIVVEDCGPDSTLETFVKEEFGDRITYYRNPRRRGLFDNWNACLELCETEWISILHDDDFLESCFVQEMLTLSSKFPGKVLLVGGFHVVNENGTILHSVGSTDSSDTREIAPMEFAWSNPIVFAGQLMKVQSAIDVGGFRKTSQYCGDWEMWTKLALHSGVAATTRIVAGMREHQVAGRGTGKVDLNGKKYALVYAQVKRNISSLKKEASLEMPFDRRRIATRTPFSIGFLLRIAKLSDRMVNYNATLFAMTPSRSVAQTLMKIGIQFFGPRFVVFTSRIIGFFESKK